MATLPKPNDPRVVLEEVPGRKMAVIKFSGFWSAERFETKTAELRDWIARRRLEPIGQPMGARYDPPWMPWFMRTNEVQIEVR